ncbi:MAG: hypothetical protein AABZ55_12105 [Bdellovibrionota bacterium]
MTAKKSTFPIKIPSAKAGDQPATRGMLYLVRDELKSEIRAVHRRLDSFDSKFDNINSTLKEHSSLFGSIQDQFKSVNARFEAVDKRFDAVDARFDELEDKMDSKFEELKSESFRMRALFEEQNANNRIVLEGLQLLWQRRERIEKSIPTHR